VLLVLDFFGAQPWGSWRDMAEKAVDMEEFAQTCGPNWQTGWWFGTFIFLFSIIYGIILPID